jgi:tetratricopeptide (TPR) repeat protein
LRQKPSEPEAGPVSSPARVYNQTITPANQQETSDFVLSWVTLLAIAIGFAGAWSNHFGSSFHWDDSHTIVENRAIRRLANVPQFFVDPTTFSTLPEHAAYRPLLLTSFAIDYRLAGPNPAWFQLENFVWFVGQLLLIYFLFRLIPGGTHSSSLFAAALYGLHPVAAETVNYTLRRGVILGASGVIAGMVLWIVWPRRMPPQLKLNLPRVPKNDLQAFMLRLAPRLSALYVRVLKLPMPLYFIPVIVGMLCDPSAAVFGFILLAYVWLFEPESGIRRALPAALICAGYWIFQCIFTWKFGVGFRPPLPGWWATQPWVAMRYLSTFFVPFHLSADSGLEPFSQFWSRQALEGYAGAGGLIICAIIAGYRGREWRGVSFGLWWFLIALAPEAMTPQLTVESNSRMFLPFFGLALAVTRVAWILINRLRQLPRMRILVTLAGPMVAAVALGVFGFETWQRNRIWESDETLWSDVIEKTPQNGRAVLNYAVLRLPLDPEGAYYYLMDAASLLPHDADVELNLALAGQKLNRDAEAEKHFRNAISWRPSWKSYAVYGEWLLNHQRIEEALSMSSAAQRLDPAGLAGRSTLMDIYAQHHDWASLMKIARETLRRDPDDPDGLRSLAVAQDGIDELARVEKAARTQPSPDAWLSLSVVYFRNARYRDSIGAAREALRLNPALGEAYSNIANAYFALGDLDEAIAAFREAQRLRPNLPQVSHNLEYLLALKARKERR